ncbi:MULTISPECIES: GTP 3',8-cyclase MoaA [unclassified Frondihabitans]|uniref:GTP 3',8-cyclase MoaA n=1 Tax=unclassified Frondihabitans TaxID=2626248 RepID=UPI000F4DF3EB|nr:MULTISPECIES: GTP 3',8-cyclase MoaA [unclassified Frondihabitans]RPE76180.1 cyclic pyranopterin monophosphate synthase subunit MoaA [Frondihabitans sp. PhB153]RPF05544.1 cyclic pyranopterin monophosphate synthase subunit MoaA [Frondihabitans sp. PhB161]
MSISLGMPTLPGQQDPARPGAVSRPAGVPGLLDRFNRVATDLRVSLTDRCNLRCTYCMPAEGLPWLDREQALSADEIVRLVGIAVRDLGVRQVRFTGGEPLLRADLIDIVSRCAALEPRPEISLTTNAIGLASRAQGLADAGLDRINVSLDSLHAETFAALTRRPFLRQVIAGVDAAAAAGLGPIKINAVLLPGINDHEAPGLLRWALERGHELRFIEQMPLDADHTWSRDSMVTAADMRQLVDAEFTLTVAREPRDGAPAERFIATARDGSGLTGTVGIIASVTEAFCEDCRRTRLTAEGSVMSCLFSHEETDLRASLRTGGSDDDIADLWRGAMWAKPKGHGIDDPSFVQSDRSMSAIGG